MSIRYLYATEVMFDNTDGETAQVVLDITESGSLKHLLRPADRLRPIIDSPDVLSISVEKGLNLEAFHYRDTDWCEDLPHLDSLYEGPAAFAVDESTSSLFFDDCRVGSFWVDHAHYGNTVIVSLAHGGNASGDLDTFTEESEKSKGMALRFSVNWMPLGFIAQAYLSTGHRLEDNHGCRFCRRTG
jgi:hypothetical protein